MADIDRDKAHVARVYDAMLGGQRPLRDRPQGGRSSGRSVRRDGSRALFDSSCPGWMPADLRTGADRKGIDAVELLRRAASLQRMLLKGDNEVVVRDRRTGDAAVLRLTEIADTG